MALANKDSLIRRVEAGRFDHAVFATYTLDIPFFEASVMRHLLRNGCRNAMVFADGHLLAVELNRLSEPGHYRTSWWYGRHYSLIPVHHTAAFHPKIFFLVGETIEVYVGSGNLEPGGLTSNLEIYHRVVCTKRKPDVEDAAIVRRIWHYISNTLSGRVPTYVRRQFARIETDVSWLRIDAEVESDTQDILGPGSDVIDALVLSVGTDKVENLFVMSPFFDAKIDALDRLIRTLRPKKTILLVQPDTVSLPGSKLADRKNLEAYQIDYDAYVHAKVIVAECARSSVLLAGSHNVSTPAFNGKNFEASLIRLNGKNSRFSELLGLTKHVVDKNRIPLDGTTLKLRSHGNDGGSVVNAWLASAQIDGNCVEVVARKKLSGDCRLVPVGAQGSLPPLNERPQLLEDGLRFVVSEGLSCSAWTAVSVADGGDQSQPVPLLHVSALENRARSSKEAEIGDRIKRLRTDITALPDILKSVSALLMSFPEHRHTNPATKNRGSKSPAPNGPIRQLSYDDFVVPWQTPTEEHFGTSARRSNLEIAVAAIARAIEGRDGGADALAADGIDVDTDASLATTSHYQEEVLAGARLEKDPESVGKLEQQFRRDDVVGVKESGARKKKKAGKQTPSAEEERLKSLLRARNSLKQFAKKFAIYLETFVEEESLSFDVFEKISSAGALMVQFVGRKMSAAKQEVELLSWQSWAEFNIRLFDVLSSSRTKFLSRLEWAHARTELHRPLVERFLGYVAVAERFCRLDALTPEQTSRILVGILRVCRVLGVYQAAVRDKAVEEAGQALLETFQGHSAAGPNLNWAKWVRTTRVAVEADVDLRNKYQKAADVAAAGLRQSELFVGDWVWWQHADGHIGVILENDGSKVQVAYEPNDSKPIKKEYVVQLSEIAPARPFQWERVSAGR